MIADILATTSYNSVTTEYVQYIETNRYLYIHRTEHDILLLIYETAKSKMNLEKIFIFIQDLYYYFKMVIVFKNYVLNIIEVGMGKY